MKRHEGTKARRHEAELGARTRLPAWVVLMLLGVSWVGVACTPYRIEYRDRPPFYEMAGVSLPSQQTLPDGTVVVYRDRTLAGELQDRSEYGEDRKPFMIRESLDDGRIVLRCLLPEHVLANLLTCIRNEEYELLWDQLLAERTRLAYQAEGRTEEDFVRFFRKRRHELAETVNRMSIGLLRSDVVVDNLRDGITRYRFHPTVADQMRFKSILMVSEQGQLKLLLIR